MKTEYIYVDRDNVISLELRESGKNLLQVQYEAITRMTITIGTTVFDSDTLGEGLGLPFDWRRDRRLNLQLGSSISSSLKGAYPKCPHVVYSADNPDGILWGMLNLVVC